MRFVTTNLATNNRDIGRSVQNVDLEPHERALTEGEIAMARQVFGNSIDYGKVKVHNHGFFWFGLQSKNTAVTPNGEIYFLKENYREDFSAGEPQEKHWFIHEMTHVWQKQLGFTVWLHGAFRFALDYDYTLHDGKRLRDYDMEAQGDLLADYFVLEFLYLPTALAQPYSQFDRALFKEVLRDFLQNQKDIGNLPSSDPRAHTRGLYDN